VGRGGAAVGLAGGLAVGLAGGLAVGLAGGLAVAAAGGLAEGRGGLAVVPGGLAVAAAGGLAEGRGGLGDGCVAGRLGGRAAGVAVGCAAGCTARTTFCLKPISAAGTAEAAANQVTTNADIRRPRAITSTSSDMRRPPGHIYSSYRLAGLNRLNGSAIAARRADESNDAHCLR
jgi:hypothetical protein